MITVEVRTALLNEAIAKMAKASGVAFAKVLKGEARLLTQDVIKLSYPRKLADGRKAVAAQIKRGIAPANVLKLPSVEGLIRSRNYALANKMFAGKWNFTPDIKNAHNSKRIRGTIPRNGGGNDFTLDIEGHKKYVRTIQKRVGLTKGSLAKDLHKLGGNAPAWIARKGTNLGSISVDPQLISIKSEARGYYTIKKQINEAMKKRTKALNKKAKLVAQDESKRLGIIRSY